VNKGELVDAMAGEANLCILGIRFAQVRFACHCVDELTLVHNKTSTHSVSFVQ